MSDANDGTDDGELLQALKNEVLESEFFKEVEEDGGSEELETIEPTLWLLRGDNPLQLTDIFQPTDLLTLVVSATSSEKLTYVKMIDSREQTRYHAKSAGTNHQFTTRLQNTRTLGEWRLEVDVPLVDSDEIKTYQLPFSLVEEIENDDPLYVTLLESEQGYILVFLDDEEEMFQMVDPDYLHVDIGEKAEDLTDDESSLEVKPPVEIEETSEEIPEITSEPSTEIKEEVAIETAKVQIPVLADLNIPINEIKGIGPATKKKLEKAGVTHVHHLLDYEGDALASATGLREKQCSQWVALARGIAANPKDPLYQKYSKVIEEPVVDPSKFELVNQELPNLNIPLSEISGVGPATVKKLSGVGITSIHHMLDHTASSIAELIGVSETKTEKWMLQVIDMAHNPDNKVYKQYLKVEIADQEEEEEIQSIILEEGEIANKELFALHIPITEISGIGPATMKKFEAVGVKFVHHLLPFSVDDLAEKTGISPKKIEKWKHEANTIANDPNNEVFSKFKT